jgi:hypothetical protein
MLAVILKGGIAIVGLSAIADAVGVEARMEAGPSHPDNNAIMHNDSNCGTNWHRAKVTWATDISKFQVGAISCTGSRFLNVNDG